MISAFISTWNLPELRSRILFTLAMIFIIRLGVYLTLPGIDINVINEWIDWQLQGEGANGAAASVGTLLNIFSGGGLQQCGLFALGIMPYISASIVMQLGTAMVPRLAKLAREEGGNIKINQYTRLLALFIALVQGLMLASALQNPEKIFYLKGIGDNLVLTPGALFTFSTTLTILASTMLLLWIGDQITERGIGNGTSLIITVNIIAAFPGALVQAGKRFLTGELTVGPLILVALIAFLLFVIAAVIALTEGQRRIVIQYAKRVVGRKMYGGQTQYLPLKVNYSGVMPIIFASALLTLPVLGLQMLFKNSAFLVKVQSWFSPASWVYYFIAGTMIFLFSYFWVATMFQPKQIAEDLKSNGGYIPGVRPGKPTADFLDFTMTRLTFAGAGFLLIVFILPALLAWWLSLPILVTQFFGGTSLLILVGVLLDIMRQVETHLIQKNYEGFLHKGKVKPRYAEQSSGFKNSNLVVYLWAIIAVFLLLFVVATIKGG